MARQYDDEIQRFRTMERVPVSGLATQSLPRWTHVRPAVTFKIAFCPDRRIDFSLAFPNSRGLGQVACGIPFEKHPGG